MSTTAGAVRVTADELLEDVRESENAIAEYLRQSSAEFDSGALNERSRGKIPL